MKVKFINIFLLVTICIFLCSCSLNINKSKPSKYYYTDELYKSMITSDKYTAIIIDTNFYKKITLDKDEIQMVNRFMKYLNKTDFISRPKDIPITPKYKMYFTFKNSKYVINIFNEKYAVVFPWDGKYSMDYIDMSKIPIAYNLIGISNYIYNTYN